MKAALEYKRRLAREERQGTNEVPPLRFIVYGIMKLSGPEEEKFFKGISECDDILSYRGPYSADDMQGLYRSVDCSIVPSVWWENSPLTIQESFMSGLPVLCSNIGGMAEKVTDRINGLHFLVGDHFDLLEKLLELSRNPDLYNRLRNNIPKIMSDLEMGRRMHQLYQLA